MSLSESFGGQKPQMPNRRGRGKRGKRIAGGSDRIRAMKILLTNDDGIEAGGLQASVDALRSSFDIAVVAPDAERSAISHAVTFRRTLRPVRLDRPYPAFAVDGTPADCVKLAFLGLLPWKPDFVLSGINRGINVGNDVLYSGTVAGALEGAMQGSASMAVSLDAFENPDFRPASRFLRDFVPWWTDSGPAPGLTLNVNLPDGDPRSYKGIRWTRQIGCLFCDRYEHRRDAEGAGEYVLDGDELSRAELEPGSDAQAVRQGYVSITPLRFELTDLDAAASLKAIVPDLAEILREQPVERPDPP